MREENGNSPMYVGLRILGLDILMFIGAWGIFFLFFVIGRAIFRMFS